MIVHPCCALWLGAVGLASADQTAFALDRGPEVASFRYAWTDGARSEHTVAFTLTSPAIAADEAAAVQPVRARMGEELVAAIRQRTAGAFEGVEIEVTALDGGLGINVAGTGDTKGASALADRVRDEVFQEWLHAHHHALFGPGLIGWDLARLASEYADDVAPVADAIRAGTSSEREFVDQSLSFVQSIPYERLRADGGGYRPPLAVLSANSGDCDSKGVLFLALVRARAPEVPLAVVHVPGHVLVGVGLPRAKGDRDFTAGGVGFVYAEPVGPGLYPFGQIADENRGPAADGVVRIVP